jgi:glycosyltransferase involved in cell wall biosynthesis
MRTDFIFLTRTDGWGGTEIHTTKLSRVLVERGHTVAIVSLSHDWYTRSWRDRVDSIRLIDLPDPTPVHRRGLAHHLRTLRPLDGRVCIFPKGWLWVGNPWLDFAARVRFPRYITIEHLMPDALGARFSRLHGGMLPGIGLWWYRALLRGWARSLAPHHVFCVSDAIRDRLIRMYHFPSRRVSTAHNGIDVERFRPSLELRSTMRTSWGVTRDTLLFGIVGRLSAIKRVDIAVSLFRRLVDEFPDRDTRLVLAGSGAEDERLRRMSGELGLGDRVHFAGFFEQPWMAYPAIDVFLMPSANEGLPLALLEAMASGCSPIAMDVGGVREVLPDSALGWLVPAGDAEAFYAAMSAAVKADPAALHEMGVRGREHVVAHFDERIKFAELAQGLERVGLGRSATPGR